MITITEELIDKLVEEYSKEHGYTTDWKPDDDFMQCIKNRFIGLHIDENEANNFFNTCYDFYVDAYTEGYYNG